MDFFKLTAFLLTVLMVFQVYGDESSDVNISLSQDCEVTVTEFTSPGNDTNIVAQNSTGFFSETMKNTGSLKSNLTVPNLNVTEQNGTWERGDKVGPVVRQFNGTEFDDVNATGERVYLQQINLTMDTGWYTGRTNVTADCYEEKNVSEDVSLEDHDYAYVNFKVVTAFGEEGGVNTTGNQTTNKTFPEDIESIGNKSTNKTLPENFSEEGNQTTNNTLPQDVNQTGEESNLTIEGNNPDVPGQTPVPKPEPEPEPEPEPGNSPDPGESRTPRLQINIQPEERQYSAFQGQFAPASIRVENVGNRTAEDVTLSPEIDRFRQGWEVNTAQVANLTPGEEVTRDVFVRPPENQEPGRYVVPVRARGPENDLDLDYFTLKVNKTDFSSRISITEAPQSINLETNSSQPVPVLIENNGEKPLTNVTARLQNSEDCGELEASTIERVEVNESASLNMNLRASEKAQSCNSTLIVSSDQGAYAFSNVQLTSTPEKGLIPPKQRPPFIAIIWTFILAGYAVLKKRYELESTIVKLPFIFLLMGETFILLYMVVSYYGIFTVSFLPF